MAVTFEKAHEFSGSGGSLPYGMDEIYTGEKFDFPLNSWNTVGASSNLFDPIFIPDKYHVTGALIYIECGFYVGTGFALAGTFGPSIADERAQNPAYYFQSGSTTTNAPVLIKFNIVLHVINKEIEYSISFSSENLGVNIRQNFTRSPSSHFNTGLLNIKLVRRTISTAGLPTCLRRTHLFCGAQLP